MWFSAEASALPPRVKVVQQLVPVLGQSQIIVAGAVSETKPGRCLETITPRGHPHHSQPVGALQLPGRCDRRIMATRKLIGQVAALIRYEGLSSQFDQVVITRGGGEIIGLLVSSNGEVQCFRAET